MDFQNEQMFGQAEKVSIGAVGTWPGDFPVGIWQCDLTGRITHCNRAAVDFWGRHPPSGPGVWCGALKRYDAAGNEIDPEQHPLAKLARGESETARTELTIERPDDTYYRLILHTRRLLDETGQLVGVYGTLTDTSGHGLTDTKQAMLSAIVQHSDDAIISKDLSGRITSWNGGAERIYGYREAEVIGRPVSLLIPPDRASEEDHILAQIKSGVTIDHFQTIRRDKKGRLIPVSLTVSPIRNAAGKLIGASKIARDISAMVNQQKTIRQHMKNLLTLNELSKSISDKLNRDEIMGEVVRAATKLTGASGGAFYHFQDPDFRQPAYRAYAGDGKLFKDDANLSGTAAWQRFMLHPQPIRTRRRMTSARLMELPAAADGNSGEAVFLAVPLIHSAGNVVGKLVLIHTGAGRFTPLDERLIKSLVAYATIALDNARLFEEVNSLNERKDEFIALAGHELKTPLTSISSYLQLLEARANDGTQRKFIAKGLGQALKMQELIDELLDVSRIESGNLELSPEAIDVGRMVPELVEQLQVAVTTHRISCIGAAGGCTIQADRKRMEQVLQNLVGNAVKYSPKGTEVTVSLDVSATECRISVTDRGIGIPPGELDRVFERYYRAGARKPVQGLGLGLYITRDIVERHGGKLHVQSVVGKGSVFTVTLPRK